MQAASGRPSGGTRGCGASCTNLELTPEKLLHATNQGDLSLAMTPEKGGREEQGDKINDPVEDICPGGFTRGKESKFCRNYSCAVHYLQPGET